MAAIGKISQWGDGLALRINSDVARALGVERGSKVNLSVVDGRLIVEKVARRSTLDELLANFDPQRHGGEAMVPAPVSSVKR